MSRYPLPEDALVALDEVDHDLVIGTVEKPTGQTFPDGAAFRKWLTENLEELGLRRRDLPKPPED